MNKTRNAWFTRLAALLVLLGTAFVVPQGAQAATNVNEPAKVQQMLAGLNSYRAQKGAPAVTVSTALTPVARDWTVHMADTGDFNHNPHYHDDSRVPAGWRAAGEIIALNSSGSAQQFINQWINSPGHEAIMRDAKYTHVGIGIARASGGLWYATINFFQYSGNPDGNTPDVDVYTTPGEHYVNGRHWRTECSDYSTTVVRCRAEIYATQVKNVGGRLQQVNDFVFNNLTYLPSPRSQWKNNPLANEGQWRADDGRQWRTSCGDSWTGPDGCRSFVLATFHEGYLDGNGQRQYRQKTDWVFNNIVRFTS
ncbi:hypothetical protein GCM10028820_03440 [Tessaracoccus terricola]